MLTEKDTFDSFINSLYGFATKIQDNPLFESISNSEIKSTRCGYILFLIKHYSDNFSEFKESQLYSIRRDVSKLLDLIESEHAPSLISSIVDLENLIVDLSGRCLSMLDFLKLPVPPPGPLKYKFDKCMSMVSDADKKALEGYELIGDMNVVPFIPIEKFMLSLCDNDQVRSQVFEIVDPSGDTDRMAVEKSRKLEDALARTYVAFALPSLCGKTQTPFCFRNLRCLYFLVDLGSLNRGSSTAPVAYPGYGLQPVYNNFYNISMHFRNFSRSDMLKFVTSGDFIGGTLLDGHMNTPLKVVGFIWALMAADDVIEDASRYMTHHANRDSFEFEELSMSEFQRRYFTLKHRFCVYLDEMCGDAWAVYVRNVCRVINSLCALAGTNAKIANLTGIRGMSRDAKPVSEYPDVWCVPVIKLPGVSPQIVKECTELIEPVVDRCVDEEKVAIKKYLKFVVDKQLIQTRPGIVILFRDLLKRLGSVQNAGLFDSAFVLGAMFSELGSEFEGQKKALQTLTGHFANASLHLRHCFGLPKLDRSPPFPWFSCADGFMNEHFYTLCHPDYSNPLLPESVPVERAAAAKVMAAGPAVPDNEKLPEDSVFTVYPSTTNLMIGKVHSLRSWNAMTYAKIEEEILHLGCLCLPPRFTAAHLCQVQVNSVVTVRNNSVNANAVSYDGNAFECLAAFAFISSSHYTFKPPQYTSETSPTAITFRGVRGVPFVENVLRNFVFIPSSDTFDRFSLHRTSTFEHSDILRASLQKLTVPFLFIANLPMSKGLEAFHLSSGLTAKFGRSARASNASTIDFHFDVGLDADALDRWTGRGPLPKPRPVASGPVSPVIPHWHLLRLTSEQDAQANKKEKKKIVLGNSGHIDSTWKVQGVVEVKNRADNLTYGTYRDIILKAVRLTGVIVTIHFTLCRKVGDLTKVRDLVNYTDTDGNSFTGNVYIARFYPGFGNCRFRLEPAFTEVANPDRIFIVIPIESELARQPAPKMPAQLPETLPPPEPEFDRSKYPQTRSLTLKRRLEEELAEMEIEEEEDELV